MKKKIMNVVEQVRKRMTADKLLLEDDEFLYAVDQLEERRNDLITAGEKEVLGLEADEKLAVQDIVENYAEYEILVKKYSEFLKLRDKEVSDLETFFKIKRNEVRERIRLNIDKLDGLRSKFKEVRK